MLLLSAWLCLSVHDSQEEEKQYDIPGRCVEIEYGVSKDAGRSPRRLCLELLSGTSGMKEEKNGCA